MKAGIAANYAEELKLRKYAALAETHQFEPIAVESVGVYMVSPLESSLGQYRLLQVTGDPTESKWFRQNLVIAIKRSDALDILSAGRERF